MKRRRAGFSLVELSIVLVILGLLVGGVLSGQALIEAARTRSISTEVQNYKAAIHTFRDKYIQLPGDITNARSFWPTCIDHSGFFNPCNGDGNGHMSGPLSGIQNYSETFRGWEHLALAGLIAGSFNSSDGSGNSYHTIMNFPNDELPVAAMPVPRYSDTANYMFIYTGDPTSCMAAFSPNIGYCDHDMILLAAMSIAANSTKSINSSVGGALMSPTDAALFDLKYDDGMPYTGGILGWVVNTTNPGISASRYDTSTAANKDVRSIDLMFVR